MAFDAHANLAYSAIAVAPSPGVSGTSLTVTTGDGALFPAAPFNCTIWPVGALPLKTNAEIVRVTAKSGDVFTITRAQEGTTARTILAGDQIANSISAKVLTDIEAVIGPMQNGNIAFPATQVPSADPNTLDDYEEGTFVPFLTTDNTASGQTYASRSGTYTKIGRVVVAHYDIVLSAKGTMTGNILISGFMPFGSTATVGVGWFPVAWHQTATALIGLLVFPAYSALSGYVQSALYGVTAATTSSMGATLTPAALTDNTRLGGTIVYFLA